MTVEQVCRAMFTRDMPDYEKRALKAAKGESVREVKVRQQVELNMQKTLEIL